MIYFKFPFDEKFYSTKQNNNTKTVFFKPFDRSEPLHFDGDLIEIDAGNFEKISIESDDLPGSGENYEAETESEYLRNLEKIIEVIKENRLPKLVYSRRKILNDFKEIDLKESFKHLCRSYPNAFRYIFNNGHEAWMGAFSEVLGKFNKATHEFETMSLAGTLSVSESWSRKEIEEQKPVSEYIENILKNYSDVIEKSETYDHISGNIKHLRNDFKIKIHPERLDSLIHDLHPTPAVCGIPKDFCKENIEKFEKYPRELYSGYIKIETTETIQYFVNLRCAKLYQNAIHLFVGGGITAQSDPHKEWTETELKSEAILKNLVIS